MTYFWHPQDNTFVGAIDVQGPLPALDILDLTLGADKDCRCPQKNDGFIWWISG
jgi:hypothetical protein